MKWSTLWISQWIAVCLLAFSAAAEKHVVFLVGDDLTHASGTHEFFAGGKLLAKSLERSGVKDQVRCTVVNNWPEDDSVFDDADVIVHYYKGNKWHFMNKNHGKIQPLAEKGVGQIFIHYAVDPEAVAEPYVKAWTGGVYKTGVSTNPHWKLKAVLEKHPINNGVNQLSLQDEWYVKMDYNHDCAVDHSGSIEKGKTFAVMRGVDGTLDKVKKAARFLKKNPKPSDLTVFWAVEREGGGRGAGITGAHFHRNWANDAFRKQVLNAILWCANMTVPEGGLDTPAISEDELNENLDKRKKGGLKRISLKN